MFSNDHRVLSCNTWLRLLYLLSIIYSLVKPFSEFVCMFFICAQICSGAELNNKRKRKLKMKTELSGTNAVNWNDDENWVKWRETFRASGKLMCMHKSKYYANLNESESYGIDDFIAHLREGCFQWNTTIPSPRYCAHFFAPSPSHETLAYFLMRKLR